MLKIVFALNCLFVLLYPVAASAWGFEGHRVTGSIASKLLKLNAEKQVRKILNELDNVDSPKSPDELDLRISGPWADCVRSVSKHDDGKFRYEVDPDPSGI